MILVVNPNNRLRTPLAAVEPPLWAGLTASYLGTDIIDAEALDLSLDQTVYEVRRRHPKEVIIVVMGNNPSVSSTPKMPIAEALADRLKPLKVSMTGIHPIAVNYQKYPVIKTPFQGTPVMPFDQLPMSEYRAHNWHCLDGSPRSPYASVYTSLGCPFDCYYCNIHTLYGGSRKVQWRPIRSIITEIYSLVSKYQVRNIKIWDELFAVNEGRVTSICSSLEGLNLNIWAYARLDTTTEKMLKAMKRGGINWLAYGFESVTDPKFTERTEDVIKMTRDAGISIIANFMFGLPGTTRDDDQKSVEFAMKHLFESVNFYTAMPYPGSAWYIDWIKNNKEPDWRDFSQYRNINEFRQKVWVEYFENPAYHSMLRRKWGEQSVNQIKEMLEKRIR